jgi:hypothetical protein
MKQSIGLLICLVSALPLLTRAQSALGYTTIDHARQLSFARQHAFGAPFLPAKKWQLSSFGGISGSYSLFNRTNASLLSAPVTLQVAHPLSKNLYAFAAVTAAPAYFNFNSFYLHPQSDKFSSLNPMTGVHPFGWYSRAEAGLFYINDEKTFSISGSIFMERSSYPAYLPVVSQRTRSVSP